MSIELKIKSKHLSEEAKIIRFEERKELKKSRHRVNKMRESGHNGDLCSEFLDAQTTYRKLCHHRRWDVRNENRATFLARAYLAGQEYSKVEQTRREENEYTFDVWVIPRIVAMVNKYGDKQIDRDTILKWTSMK